MGDDLKSDAVALSMMSCAVLSSPATAVRFAQEIAGSQPDGIMGPNTLGAVNDMPPDVFCMAFALKRIDRYRKICMKDRTQRDFLLGWLNRSFKDLEDAE